MADERIYYFYFDSFNAPGQGYIPRYRPNSINEPSAPPSPLVLSSLAPPQTNADGNPCSLTCTGSGFIASSAVVFGGRELATTYQSPTQVTANAPASTVAKTVNVRVRRNTEMSAALPFEYLATGELQRSAVR